MHIKSSAPYILRKFAEMVILLNWYSRKAGFTQLNNVGMPQAEEPLRPATEHI